MSPLELLCMASLAALLGVAVFSDLRTRRIPNALVVTGIALAAVFVVAWKQGRSPLEIVSASANKAFVETIRRRFPGQA